MTSHEATVISHNTTVTSHDTTVTSHEVPVTSHDTTVCLNFTTALSRKCHCLISGFAFFNIYILGVDNRFTC